MNKILETLGVMLLGSEARELQLRELQVQFIRNKEAILQTVNRCRKSHGLIGVYSAALGDGMFLTTVENIRHQGNRDIIEIKPYDFSGRLLKTSTLLIDEISCVCPFNQIYIQPRRRTKMEVQKQP